MKIAIIPARGGSKRIPGKNIKLFHGKPIINYAIDAAHQSGLFDRVVVSTDSEEIADVAKSCGADVPFLRPTSIADDFATTASVLSHCLEWFVREGAVVEQCCCIYPTAVFLKSEYLHAGYELLVSRHVASVFSVASFASSPFRALLKDDRGHLVLMNPEYELTRTNDLPFACYDAGQFYWLNVKKFLKKPQLYTVDALPVVLPIHLVQDIDTLDDWKYAELMFEVLAKREQQNGESCE